MDYFVYSHTMEIGDDDLALVHIDTSFLAYGPDGEPQNRYMKEAFAKYKRNDIDELLEEIDVTLCENKDRRYKIVIGHHPIGPACGGKGQNKLSLLQPMLK